MSTACRSRKRADARRGRWTRWQPRPPPSVEQRDFNEYKLYEIARPVTVGENETKQVEFVTAASVPAHTFFVYDGSQPYYGDGSPITDQYYGQTGITDVQNYLEFNTGDDGGLGAALPAGRVRVYQQDVDGSALLIGENSIDHTPKGEDVQLYPRQRLRSGRRSARRPASS